MGEQVPTGETMVDLKATRGTDVAVTAFHCAGPDGPRQLAAYIARQRAEGYTVETLGERPIMREVTAREAIYDAEIAPLMRTIIEVCKRADIPIVAAFQLDDERDPDIGGFVCRTTIVPEDGSQRMRRAAGSLFTR